MNQTVYHKPVLLTESIEGLAIKPNGVYVDATFGGGGHAKAILEKLDKAGKLYAFDQDADAQAGALADPRFTFFRYNFRHISQLLKASGITQIDGLLADLGVSSHQFDSAARGFSTRFDAQLDMRMNQNDNELTAGQILADYSAQKLQTLFSEYGEITNAKTLAEDLVQARSKKSIVSTAELKSIITPLIRKKAKVNQYYAQVFQALRIEVNQELAALKDLLLQATDLLKPGGRLVVIAYHSLEDRLVKNLINKGNCDGKIEKDLYGNQALSFEPLCKRPKQASPEEIADNNRARSGKLRIGIRTTSLSKTA